MNSLSLRNTRFKADLSLLLVAMVWGSAFVVCRVAAQQIGAFIYRVDVLRLALFQYIACGVLSWVVGLAFEWNTLSGFALAWQAVMYTGVLSIGLAYTLQIMGRRHAPPADAAIILSLEAVFAALAGWLILGETLTIRQLIGSGLLLAGMLVAQMRTLMPAQAPAAVDQSPESLYHSPQ